jgi:hypothetical protein
MMMRSQVPMDHFGVLTVVVHLVMDMFRWQPHGTQHGGNRQADRCGRSRTVRSAERFSHCQQGVPDFMRL